MSADPWHILREHTSARIALGRTGGSLPTSERLAFQLAHAQARDAVLAPFGAEELADRLRRIVPEVVIVESAARDRSEFLQRPNLGRQLASKSRQLLTERAAQILPCDLVVIISDGLSSLAAETQAEPLVAALWPLLITASWTLSPLIVARYARVALQDEIGDVLRSKLSLILVGERPGLGSADSLGAYFTYGPRVGRTDAERNCISNIRPGGLVPPAAAEKLSVLLQEARRQHLSGVRLKDDLVLPGSQSGSIEPAG